MCVFYFSLCITQPNMNTVNKRKLEGEGEEVKAGEKRVCRSRNVKELLSASLEQAKEEEEFCENPPNLKALDILLATGYDLRYDHYGDSTNRGAFIYDAKQLVRNTYNSPSSVEIAVDSAYGDLVDQLAEEKEEDGDESEENSFFDDDYQSAALTESAEWITDSLLPFIEKEYRRFIIVEGDGDDEEEGKGKEKEKEKRTEEECDKAVFEFFSNLFSNLQ